MNIVDLVNQMRATQRGEITELLKKKVSQREQLKRKESGQDLMGRLKIRCEVSQEVVSQARNIYSPDLVITQIKNRYEQKANDPQLDLTKINPEYQVLVSDGTVDNPFIISKELMSIIREHTRSFLSPMAKARAIFDWMQANISYGKTKHKNGYSNSVEVLENKEAICGEMAVLYITMARAVNLRSAYVSVKRDLQGDSVHHGCAIVDVIERQLLVDPAYHTFDICHQEFEVLTDNELIKRYSQWRRYT